MAFIDKVEEIRKKPEHIRTRYVWFFVTLSMIFVIIIWIFSISASLQEGQESYVESATPGSDILSQFEKGKSSFENAASSATNISTEQKTSVFPVNEMQNNNILDDLNNARQ